MSPIPLRIIIASLLLALCLADTGSTGARSFAIKHCKSAVSHINCGLGAFPQSKVFKLVSRCIENKGFKPENLLIATSCCPDEINRDLDQEIADMGRPFCMGGWRDSPLLVRPVLAHSCIMYRMAAICS